MRALSVVAELLVCNANDMLPMFFFLFHLFVVLLNKRDLDVSPGSSPPPADIRFWLSLVKREKHVTIFLT